MRLDWRTAYLNQARADYARYLELAKQNSLPPCHRLHYLQMATEKLGKGSLTALSGPRPPRVHDAFVEFVRAAKWRDDLRRLSGFSDWKRYRAYIDSLLPKARELEDLSPEGPDHPNPEYPWEANGIIISPLDYAFSTLDATKDAKMSKLLRFIDNCFKLI